MNSDRSDTPRNVLPELIIPLLALGFTVYYLTTIVEVPWIAQASAITVASLLILSILAFAVRTFIRVRRGTEIVSLAMALDTDAATRRVTRQRFVLLGLTLSYLVALPFAGFTLSTLIFIFSGVITLSSWSNWRRALTLAVTCSIIGYVVFIQLFRTRFPSGPIEDLLKSVF